MTSLRSSYHNGAIIDQDRKTYSDAEFALILRKASEMAGSEAVRRSGDGLSLEEMKAVAGEVGLDPALIERAARHLPLDAGQTGLERVIGGPVSYRVEAQFAQGLTDDRATRLLSAVRAAAEQQGEGQADASGMSWHSLGDGNQILVTAHDAGDETVVRVVVDRRGALVPVGMFTCIGTLAVSIAMIVGFEAVELQSQLLGWSLLSGGVLGGLATGRAVWASGTQRLRSRLDRVMDTVNRSLSLHAGDAESPPDP